jgi:hypothetical protein
MMLWYIKAAALFILVLLTCPLIFLGLVGLLGKYMGITIAPDSLIARFYKWRN